MLITFLCGSEIVLLIYQGLFLPDSLDIVGQTIFTTANFIKITQSLPFTKWLLKLYLC